MLTEHRTNAEKLAGFASGEWVRLCNRCNAVTGGGYCEHCGSPEYRIKWIGPMPENYDPAQDFKPLLCPVCHQLAMADDWDCLGADIGKLFCPSCGNEVHPVILPEREESQPAQRELKL